MPEALLALDLGTTRLKVAAFDLQGALLASASARNIEHSDGSRRWQDPAEWWADASRLVREVTGSTALAGRTVCGVGVSGRGGGFVPLDGRGQPVAPSWSDNRHESQLQRLLEWRQRRAHLSNYAAAPLAKYLWLREHEPGRAREVARLLYAKDWLVFRMTGRAVTDPTSGPDAHDFDRERIATLEVDPALLPDVDLPWAVAGALTRDAADELGLPAGIPVAVGGHDGICANVGAGAGGVGAYAITIGTHAVVRAVQDATPEGAYRFYGMPPGRHIIGGNALMAGRAADWFLDGWLGVPPEEQRRAAFVQMDAEAARVAPGADGVRFLPFLSGQVAPARRPQASGAFAGLRAAHGRAEMYRAVLEGGAFAIRGVWDQVEAWCGPPRVARFTGSGALSEVWRQIIVDCIDSPCEVVDGFAEARGAAIFAAVAVGAYADIDQAAAAMVHPSTLVEPDPAGVAAYREVYEEWQRVSEVMRALEPEANEPGVARA